MKSLSPRDHREAVALFRAEIIGALTRRELAHGALALELAALASVPRRVPGASVTRRFGVSTLERWYYTYKRAGLAGLIPKPRADRGVARGLSPEQRELVVAIRREHPRASAEVSLEALVAEGRLDAKAVSARVLRRLFREHGLDRVARRATADPLARLRWEADHPGAVWQVDVCHGPSLRVDGRLLPVRVHAILDDASRYIVALEAFATERERDMLALFADAIRRHGPPSALYLDNGSTYSGDALRLACERLGVTLIHSKPYQPQGRGKIERFFRTLRAKCLDYVGDCPSLHAVNARLLAFLDQHYHHGAHAGLMGRTPGAVWREGAPSLRPLDANALRDAFTTRESRRVRRDSTLDVAGAPYEVTQAFLAGKNVTVARVLIDEGPAWVEHDGQRFDLLPVDVKRNNNRPRIPQPAPPPTVHFDPATTRLDCALSRNRRPTSETS